MAAIRGYKRDSKGRFAGAGSGGGTVTFGRAGGFSNAAFRARVRQSTQRASAAKLARGRLQRRLVKGAAAAAGTGLAFAALGIAARSRKGI
jgi:hypothetical protein